MPVVATYVLPLKSARPMPAELTAYLDWLHTQVDVIVVDGSADAVFDAHHEAWPRGVLHLHAAGGCSNGKVAGVLTGLRHARHDRVIIADDDVRYDEPSLRRAITLLDRHEVVRPQNYYVQLSWHARLDTARSLLNRVTGGDWPGTLAVRRSVLEAAGGYDGEALFENLELVRTIVALGGREAVPLDLYVPRLPPSASHFLSQRIRQAYDELARPLRLFLQLTLLPLTVALVVGEEWPVLAALAGVAISAAEVGRRRGGGRRVFPATASLAAPLWLAERAFCIWLAVGARFVVGGIPYRGTTVRLAAHSVRDLRRRVAAREVTA
jgi:hypothetical protein